MSEEKDSQKYEDGYDDGYNEGYEDGWDAGAGLIRPAIRRILVGEGVKNKCKKK